MVTSRYHVQGMSCQHCISAVSEEISAIQGVHGVSVDLGSGIVTIDSDRELEHSVVAQAVDEAGYNLQ